MNKTKIETIKNPDGTQGYSWNPISGCKYHTPEGLCLGGMFPCYAFKLANGRLRSRYLANKNVAPYDSELDYEKHKNDPFYPRFWVNRAREEFGSCYAGAEPKGIFVCDMSDLFGIGIPEEWTRRILNKIGMSYYREHRFYLLTKQPQNLIKFSPFPDHCYVGVTVTKPEFLLPALDAFDRIQCSVRYLSIEPMLAAFDVPGLSLLLAGSVDWLILGSQTKPYKPPKIEWVQEIVEACDRAGIPVFLKDNLKPLLFPNLELPRWARTPHSLTKLRQEMPGTDSPKERYRHIVKKMKEGNDDN